MRERHFDPIEAFKDWKGGVCNYYYEFKDGVTFEENTACHYGILFHPPKYMTGVYSSLRGNSKAVREYWDYILNPEESPWRGCLKGRKIYKDGNKYIGFYIPINKDTSYQLVGDLLIATRVPNEHDQSLRAFKWALDNGLTLPEALLISIHLKYDGQSLDINRSGWHFAFNPENHISLKDLRDGTPPQLNALRIWKGEGDGMTNYMWSAPEASAPRLLELLNGSEKYSGQFPNLFRAYHYDTLSFKDGIVTDPNKAMRIIKANRDKL